ncbi:nuclear transport factor 2 family protein [Streptomyces sp. NPDC002143]
MSVENAESAIPFAVVQELLDKEAIRDVIYRFCRGADRMERDLVQSCYHSDAIDHHGPYHGPGHGFYDAANAIEIPKVMHHHVGQTYIQLEGHVAKVETYCLATFIPDSGDVSTWVVRYLDRFEKRDGEWKIAHRFVAFDTILGEGGMGAMPENSYGHRDRTDYSHTLFAKDAN